MLSVHLVAMILATLVGVSLGALGGGGSIITTPVLVYVAQIPPPLFPAAPTRLVTPTMNSDINYGLFVSTGVSCSASFCSPLAAWWLARTVKPSVRFTDAPNFRDHHIRSRGRCRTGESPA